MSKCLFVTGSSGVGKSTATALLADTAPGTWARIDQDHIRSFVKAGYVAANQAWTEETKRQWDVSILICCDMVKRYYAVDINCVIDCFVASPKVFDEEWRPNLVSVNYSLAVLSPDVEVAVRRNNKRDGATHMTEEQVRNQHTWFMAWRGHAPIIDTSTLSVEDVIKALLSELR